MKFSALLWLPVAGLLLCAAAVWPPAIEPGRERTILDPFYVGPGEVAPAMVLRKASRNDPCPCGSGKKYKACHGGAAAKSPASWISKRYVLAAAAFCLMCLIAAVVIESAHFFPKDLLACAHGARLVNADHVTDYQHYMAGELAYSFSNYFAVAYLLKEPLAGIILAVFGVAILFRTKSISPIGRLFLLLPPIFFYIGTAFLADQLGVRYIIPTLPFAHPLGGLALSTLFTAPARLLRYGGFALCAWLIVAAVGIYPDHLSSFNESACLLSDPARIGFDGGSKCGNLWLDDSNVDWGQGLRQLKLWLAQHEAGRTIRYSSQFPFPPDIDGIESVKASPIELGTTPTPGLYVVSSSIVARIPAIRRASDWLRRIPTVGVVGHALYVYEFPEETHPRQQN